MFFAWSLVENHSVRCNQPIVFFSHTKSALATSYQPASSTFFSQQISTSHQPNEVISHCPYTQAHCYDNFHIARKAQPALAKIVNYRIRKGGALSGTCRLTRCQHSFEMEAVQDRNSCCIVSPAVSSQSAQCRTGLWTRIVPSEELIYVSPTLSLFS